MVFFNVYPWLLVPVLETSGMMRKKNSDNPNLRRRHSPVLMGPQSDQSDGETQLRPQGVLKPSSSASRERSEGFLHALKHPLTLWAWLSLLGSQPTQCVNTGLLCSERLSLVPRRCMGIIVSHLVSPRPRECISWQPREAWCLFESLPFETQTLRQLSHSPERTWGEGGTSWSVWDSGGLPCPFCPGKGACGQ